MYIYIENQSTEKNIFIWIGFFNNTTGKHHFILSDNEMNEFYRLFQIVEHQ